MTALMELKGPAAVAAKEIEAQEQFSGVQSMKLRRLKQIISNKKD